MGKALEDRSQENAKALCRGGSRTLPPPGAVAPRVVCTSHGGTDHPLRYRTRYSNFYFYLVVSHVNFFLFLYVLEYT